jgi:transposase InsO family protein
MEDRLRVLELIGEAVAGGARRVRACNLVGISLRTLQRWESQDGSGDQRGGALNGPKNALSEAERALVVAVATSPMYRDLPPSQIVPILADAGVYMASESSFYRILREEKLLAHRGRARAATHGRPSEQVATGPNQVWSWDISYLKSPVKGQFYYLYLVVDVWSRKITGWAVHEMETDQLAAALIREAALREGVDADELVLHSDNGGPMKGATMLATLQWLGIVPSFSRPRVCDDNPYSEALFRTVKYRPGYPSRPFESLEVAREWVKGFVGWYNDEHRHSAIRFVTPSQRHCGEEQAVLDHRKEVYRKAREQKPGRWSGEVRNWDPIKTVVLNPSNRTVDRSRNDRKSA